MKVYKADNSGSDARECAKLMRFFKTKPFIGTSRIPRNGPCVCGSGKKFKKCCWKLYVQDSIDEKEKETS